jgi:hypothetical protein
MYGSCVLATAAFRLPEGVLEVLAAALPEFLGAVAAAIVIGAAAWVWRRVVRWAGRQERE